MTLNDLGYSIKWTRTEKRINHNRRIAHIGAHREKNSVTFRKSMFYLMYLGNKGSASYKYYHSPLVFYVTMWFFIHYLFGEIKIFDNLF